MEPSLDIEIYETANGKCPFLTWKAKLPQRARDLVNTRIARLRLANYGDCKSLKGVKGIYELRIHDGPGYRIYYGKQGRQVILLLSGGSKSTQKRDIEKAKRYWDDYLNSS